MGKSKKSEKRSAAAAREKKNKNEETDEDERLNKQLGQIDLELREITGDGNCLFRAISDQMTGRENNHRKFRREAANFINQNQGMCS